MGLESGEIDKTGATTTNASSIPTGYKLIIKAVVILMTLGGFSLGIGTLVTVNPLCIVAGVLLILEGVLIFIFELPILFNCIRCLEPLIRFSEGRAGWQKAFIYIIIPIIAICFCQSIWCIFGLILYALISIIYIMIDVMNRRRR